VELINLWMKSSMVTLMATVLTVEMKHAVTFNAATAHEGTAAGLSMSLLRTNLKIAI
jgi:hypothetical protein